LKLPLDFLLLIITSSPLDETEESFLDIMQFFILEEIELWLNGNFDGSNFYCSAADEVGREGDKYGSLIFFDDSEALFVLWTLGFVTTCWLLSFKFSLLIEEFSYLDFNFGETNYEI
jgi:hypothetical protein